MGRKPPVTKKLDPDYQADPSKCKSEESKNGQHQWGGGHHPTKTGRYECKNKGCDARGHFDKGTGSIQLGDGLRKGDEDEDGDE